MSTFSNWIKNSYTVKFGIIGILVLILLIPSMMIQSLIAERQERSNSVSDEISSKWGNSQTIAGPFINIPFKQKIKTTNTDGTTTLSESIGTIHMLPEVLTINNKVKTETKHRGMYKSVVYTDNAQLNGSFNINDIAKLNIPAENILWNQAYLALYITDLRGIKSQVKINWNNQPLEMNPGIDNNDIQIFGGNKQYHVNAYSRDYVTTDAVVTANAAGNENSSGLSVPIDVQTQKQFTFDFNLDLRGSNALQFVPVGKETKVSVNSDYTSPSFDGAFVTDANSVTEKGFTSSWKILHLNRNFPQQWTNNDYDINNSAFGVNFLVPVDHYQKTMRSAKYAVMFIFLTFLIFVFSEILNGYKIHPVQYLLIGLALVIFYTLLLSISEQLGFTWAYVISSIAIICLISLYSMTIFKENKLVAVLCGILIILYGFLFVILRSEDYALLLGSIGLFTVLAVVMYLSRKVKWYGEGNEQLG